MSYEEVFSGTSKIYLRCRMCVSGLSKANFSSMKSPAAPINHDEQRYVVSESSCGVGKIGDDEHHPQNLQAMPKVISYVDATFL